MGNLYSSESLLHMMDGNSEEVKELAFMLFDLGPQMISDIENLIENKNWNEAGSIAHKLKSTLKLWQMNEIVSLAFFIEEHGHKGEKTTEIISNFKLLKEGFNKALAEMKLEFN